ncbi:MAG: hypothetical protein V3T21_02020, partial [Candidatus Margulisiibacteriota bacterium]
MFKYSFSSPLPPARIKLTDDTRIYRHSKENPETYQRHIRNVNYLAEMFKFFSKYLQHECIGDHVVERDENGKPISYTDEYTEALTEFGELQENGQPSFGQLHTQKLGDTIWGTFNGGSAQNLNFHPAAGEGNHFTDQEVAGADQALDLNEWFNKVFEGASVEDLDPDAVNLDDYDVNDINIDNYADFSGDWSQVKDYMSQYGD